MKYRLGTFSPGVGTEESILAIAALSFSSFFAAAMLATSPEFFLDSVGRAFGRSLQTKRQP